MIKTVMISRKPDFKRVGLTLIVCFLFNHCHRNIMLPTNAAVHPAREPDNSKPYKIKQAIMQNDNVNIRCLFCMFS